MKYIDISTSHNISVRYELANLMARILSTVIDLGIMYTIVMLFSILSAVSSLLFYVIAFLFVSFYHLAFELLLNGQSPGKKVLKLKVVTLHGRTPKAQDYFLRWIFRLLEITLTVGTLAIIYVASTEKNQRIGDMLAGTAVVKLRPDRVFDLATLIKLGKEKRTITFPKVVMYNDDDMMLVKDALQRYRAKSNDTNTQFLIQLATRVADDLELEKSRLQGEDFLERVLLDYITLTR